MENLNSYNFFDFCSGIGAGRLAFESNNLSCVGHCEIEKTADYIYSLMFDNCKNYGDITKLDIKKLPDFNYLIAGFPCQTFSIAGKRLGFEDQRGTIIYNIIKILEEKKPNYFLLENVKGLISHNKGNTLKTILNELDATGYNVYYKVLNSLDFGVAQKRERIYIVGIKKDINYKEFKFPDSKLESNLKDFLNPNKAFLFNKNDEVFNKYLNNKYNKGKFDLNKILENDYTVLDTRQSDLRLYFNKIPTLRAGRHGLLYTFNKNLYKLSAKESLLLQGFTNNKISKLDNYNIGETKILTKAGNAMTVNVIDAIIKELLKYEQTRLK